MNERVSRTPTTEALPIKPHPPPRNLPKPPQRVLPPGGAPPPRSTLPPPRMPPRGRVLPGNPPPPRMLPVHGNPPPRGAPRGGIPTRATPNIRPPHVSPRDSQQSGRPQEPTMGESQPGSIPPPNRTILAGESPSKRRPFPTHMRARGGMLPVAAGRGRGAPPRPSPRASQRAPPSPMVSNYTGPDLPEIAVRGSAVAVKKALEAGAPIDKPGSLSFCIEHVQHILTIIYKRRRWQHSALCSSNRRSLFCC